MSSVFAAICHLGESAWTVTKRVKRSAQALLPIDAPRRADSTGAQPLPLILSQHQRRQR
jgi:hypothetical protein